MKVKILLSKLLIVFSIFQIYAQGISYTDVVTVRATPAENLIYNAHLWLGNNVETEDVAINVIETTRELYTSLDLNIYYDVKIEIKDNEYTYTFNNFSHHNKTGGIDHGLIKDEPLCLSNAGKIYKIKLLHKSVCAKIKSDIDEHIRAKVKYLREAMRNEVEYEKPVFVDHPPHGIVYTNLIEIENITQDELYSKSRVWFSETYTKVNQVLKIKDETAGILIGIAGFNYEAQGALSDASNSGSMNYKVKLNASDGILNYTISDFTHHSFGLVSNEDICFEGTFLITKKRKENLCADMKTKIDEHAQMLINTLLENTKKQSNTDWLEAKANGGYLYSEVVEVANELDKSELYDKGKAWLKKEYLNPDRVLEIKDRKAGELYAKVYMKFKYMGRNDNIHFDLRLQVKDNQYKYSFFNFSHTADNFMKKGNFDFGFIYNNAEKCYINKSLLMTKKQRQKACTLLKEQIETEVARLVSSMSETIK